MAAIHPVYYDRQLIKSTLQGHGVDPNNPSSYHRLKGAEKSAVAQALADASGASPNYCDWVIRDYVGQTCAQQRRQLSRHPEVSAMSRRFEARHLGENIFKLAGISTRTKAAKAALTAVEEIGPDLSFDEFKTLRPALGVDVARQLAALRGIMRRRGLDHLLPERTIRQV